MIAAAAAAALSVQPFRYERTVRVDGSGVVEVVPDGPMYAHTRLGFADLRVLDEQGEQVAWREAPQPPALRRLPLVVLDRGRRGGAAVARVRTPVPVDRVTLVVPDRHFVGTATVYGSTDAQTWTRVAATQIYSVAGASAARSTTVLLPPNDFRYLELRATHVTRIDGALVTRSDRTPLRAVPAHVRTGRTIVVDVGHPNTPVDELRITSTTPRYNRPFEVTTAAATVGGRLIRVDGPNVTIVPLGVRTRYLRIRIANGDDPPLQGLHVGVYARRRPLLLAPNRPGTLRLYYGARVRAPVYDFARLPAPRRTELAALGPEHANPRYHVADTRSVFARHRSLVTVALALAAALLVAAGGLALRRT